MTRTRLAAPAKVNLQLSVEGRRKDGYHLIDSLAVFAELADTVSIEFAASPSFSISGPFAAPLKDSVPEEGAVDKAVGVFHGETGLSASYCIELDKQIPVAAGIGGGSADAAATLVLLNRLHGEPLDHEGLDRAGLAVGADVPACIRSHADGGGEAPGWQMRGIGEQLDRVPLPSGLGLLLVNGGDAVSTASVFEAFDGTPGMPRPRGRESERPPEPRGKDALKEWIALGNDLLGPAIGLSPGIADSLEAVGGLWISAGSSAAA